MTAFRIMMVVFILSASAFGAVPAFYANKELQNKYPDAFATMPLALQFHEKIDSISRKQKDLLIEAILKDSPLYKDIIQFEVLSLDSQVAVLEKLFILECETMKIIPPELIIDEVSIPGYAFFEFDYLKGGPGKVFINKRKLREEKNKSDFIVLLLHETRHSAQFQLSQFPNTDVISYGFRASFDAQKEMKVLNLKTSFCDFMLLLNEYEAFQFANYVYGSLTNWKSPINDMGTLAGQYDENGEVRINMIDILTQTQVDPIELFNRLEKVQYDVMYE